MKEVTIADLVVTVISPVEQFLESIQLPPIGGTGSIDVMRLLDRLKIEPTNRHDMYCLGKGYMYLKDWQQAEKWFRRRSESNGWEEQRWHAHHLMSSCQKQMGKEEQFISTSLASYQIRPTRAEPLYWLARHYREKQMYEAAMMICEVGSKIRLPSGDCLEVDPFVYEWGFAEEISVSGNYCTGKRYQAGKAACKYLASYCSVKEAKDRAEANLAHYSR